MLRRTCFAAGLVLLLAVAGLGAFAWRVASGPVSIAPAAGWIKQALSSEELGVTADFAAVTMAWNRPRRTLDFNATDVTFVNGGEMPLASLPRVTMRLSIPALRRGVFAPSTIILPEGAVTVEWTAGELAERLFGPGEAGEMGDILDIGAIPIVANLVAETEADGSLSALRHFVVERMDIALVEQASGAVWRLPDSRLDIRREGGDILVGLAARLLSQTTETGVAATLRLAGNREDIDLGLEIADADLPKLAGELALETPLAGVEAVFSGVASARMSRDGHVRSAEFELAGDDLRVTNPEFLYSPRDFEHFLAKGRFSGAARVVNVDMLELGFGGVTFSADGVIYGENGGTGLRLLGELTGLTPTLLIDYWPKPVSKGGYRWIRENITAGSFPTGKLVLDILPAHIAAPEGHEDFVFTFTFEELVAHYLRPMPPIADGAGVGRLINERLVLDVETGTVESLTLTPSSVVLRNLDQRGGHMAEIEVNLDGAAEHVLRLIDYEPLGYTSDFGIAPSDVEGHAVTSLQVEFPLKRTVRLADVAFRVQSNIDGFAIPDLMAGGGLSDGLIALDVDRDRLQGEGTVLLNGVPFEVNWQEDFAPPEDGFSSRYTLNGMVGEGDFAKFDLPVDDPVTGPVPVSAEILGSGTEIEQGRITFDLTQAEIFSPTMAWTKPAQVPAAIDISLAWRGGMTEVTEATIVEDGVVKGEARAVIDTAAGRIISGEVGNITTGGHDLDGAIEGLQGGGYAVTLRARSLDIRDVLRSTFAPEPDAEPLPLVLHARADRVLALNDVVAEDLRLNARRGALWEEITLDLLLDAEHRVGLDLVRGADGRSLRFISEDAARTGAALGLFNNGEGGTIELAGAVGETRQDPLLEGELRIDDLKIVGATGIAGAVEEGATESGFDDLIGEDGLKFNRIRLPFRIQDNVIDVTRGRARGPNIGFTLEGQSDQRVQRLSINGLIVPAYRINALFSNIPVVGNVLTGGKGQGMFGMTYRIQGDIDDPEITVNPLTALAPGILRRFFEGPKGTLEDLEAEPVEKAAPEPTGDPEVAQEPDPANPA